MIQETITVRFIADKNKLIRKISTGEIIGRIAIVHPYKGDIIEDYEEIDITR